MPWINHVSVRLAEPTADCSTENVVKSSFLTSKDGSKKLIYRISQNYSMSIFFQISGLNYRYSAVINNGDVCD